MPVKNLCDSRIRFRCKRGDDSLLTERLSRNGTPAKEGGYRESQNVTIHISTASWSQHLRSTRERGGQMRVAQW